MSSTREGSIREVFLTDLRIEMRRSSARVSLKPPLRALVRGVRRAQVMTCLMRYVSLCFQGTAPGELAV